MVKAGKNNPDQKGKNEKKIRHSHAASKAAIAAVASENRHCTKRKGLY